jgi:class 3 adenylate cyclase
MFTDIVDSTAIAASLGDRAWVGIIRAHHRIIRAHLARYRLAVVAAHRQHLPVAEFLIDAPLEKDGDTRLRPIVRAQRGSRLEEADGPRIMEALAHIGWAGSSDVAIDLGELSGIEPGGERALATGAARVRSDAYRVLVVVYPREGPIADALEASGILGDQRIKFHPTDVA